MPEYKEIDFKMLVKTIKNTKIIIIITLSFTVIGFICGCLYVNNSSFDYKASASKLELINGEYIIFDKNYYKNYYDMLIENTSNIKTYADTLMTYDKEKMEQILFEIKTIEDNQIIDLEELIEKKHVFPIEFIEEVTNYYNDQIVQTEKDLNAAIESKEFIMGINGAIPENTATAELYNAQFKKASKTFEYKNSLNTYRERLEFFKDLNNLKNKDREVENLFKMSNNKLNQLIDNFNQFTDVIAKDNAFIISAGMGIDPKKSTDFSVIIENTFVQPDFKDDILAFTIFFALFGLCVGYLTALCKLAKVKKQDIQI